MSKLNKTKSGLLFYDDFSERTLLWQLSPSDANCLKFGGDGLRIIHNRRYVTFTIPEPDTDEYSCIVELEHIPANYDDIAGVIVLSSNKEYAECQSYLATGPSELNNSTMFNDDVRRIVKEEIEKNDSIVWFENNNVPDKDVGNISGSEEQDKDFKDTVYRYIKLTKQKYRYMFWASEDTKKWIEVGNVKFDDSGVIGFFLYGTTDEEILENSHCYFKNVAIYDGRYLIIDGISRKYEFEMFDENGTILMRTDDIAFYGIMSRSTQRTVINTINMPMPIRNVTLRIFKKNDYENTIAGFNLGEETYGGDMFYLEQDIRVYIGQNEIKTNELYDLGTFFRGNYFIRLSVMNCEDYPVGDVKLRIVRYSEYYGGEEEVEIALSEDGIIESELEYKKELIIPEIQVSESRDVFMRLMDKPDQGFYMAANDYRFKIMIE